MSSFQRFQFGDLFEIASGLSKPREDFGFGHPFVSYRDIYHNYFLEDDLEQLANTTEQERDRCSVKRGDIFLTRTSETVDELGMSCVSLKDYPNATFNGFSKRLRLKVDTVQIYPEFIAYYLRSQYFRQQVDSMAVMTTRASLNNEMIGRIFIDLPSLPEQIKIADALKSLDDKIKVNKKTNAVLESMAKAIFKEWFIDFGPVKAKAEGKKPFGMDDETAALFPDSFEDSEFGQIPKGWSITTLGDTCDLLMGQSPPGETYNENGNGMVFYQGRAEFGSRYPTPRLFCSEPSRVVKQGTVLLSVRAPVGDLNISIEEQTCIGRGLTGILHKTGGTTFTYYLLQSLKDKFDMYNGEGTVFGSINKDTLSGIKFIMPSCKVLTKFLTQVLPLDELYFSNFKESRSLTQARDLLLPKLISGEISLTEGVKNG